MASDIADSREFSERVYRKAEVFGGFAYGVHVVFLQVCHVLCLCCSAGIPPPRRKDSGAGRE
jgi:hypothetical protein